MSFQLFEKLHRSDSILRLSNCWDAGSARLFQSLGASAIATTSAGLAWSAGYSDGQKLPAAELVATVQRIARVVAVPLTIDVEAGYSDNCANVADLVMQLLHQGVVGINIEDGRDEPALLAAKIEAIKSAATKRSMQVFVNARTDVYLKGLAPESGRSVEVLQRAELYRNAGADGLFVPSLLNSTDISDIVQRANLPINLMAHKLLPSVVELKCLGVRRLSAGAAICQAMFARAAELASLMMNQDSLPALFENTTSSAELNTLFS
jgi:2-methylisocitrate lyase-like PEP mutase family enzyme